MKKMLLAFALFLAVPLSSVFAQEPVLAQIEQADPSSFVTVATVNIYDARITSQEQNTFDISFDLSNREFIQPDVRYAVQLLKEGKDGAQSVIDEHIYDEVINLNENQTIKKQISYVAPEYLKGKFDMWLFAKNQNGLTLALANLGEVVLIGNGEFAEIAVDTCYLTVNDDKDMQYALQQGVDITEGEKLTATCDVINRTSAATTIVPEFKTFWRTSFGQEVPTENEPQESTSLNSGEKKQLSFTLPQVKQPQAYDAQLTLKNTQGKIISNHATFHYVLSGLSATIQNLRLDKSYYTKGDTAHASFFWSGSAGGFFGARVTQDDDAKLFVAFAVTDKNDKTCIEKTIQELDPKMQTPEFALPITRDCLDPHITVALQDESGRALDTRTYDLTSDQAPAETKNTSTQKPLIFYGGIFVAVLFVISLLIIAYKHKRGMSVIIFFGFVIGLLLVNYGGVRADTFSGAYVVRTQFNTTPYTWHGYAITANLDKSTYIAGDNMTGNITGISVDCANSLIDYSLLINLKGTDSVKNMSKTHSVTTLVPSPGDYDAKFTFRDNRCFSGVGTCTFNDSLYLANKTSQVNSVKLDGRSNWTESQVLSAINACAPCGGTLKGHYDVYGKSEGVSPCKADCGTGWDAKQPHPIPYTVVAAPTTPPANCTSPWGTTVLHGRSITAYLAETGSPCVSQTRTCNDGVLSGWYKYQTCTNVTLPPAPKNCPSPWGTTVLHGNSITAYEFSTGATCPPHTLTCNDGILNGGGDVYKFQTCTPNTCPANRPVDTAICQDDTVYIPNGVTSWTNVEMESQCTTDRKCEYYSKKTQIAPVEKEGSGKVIETKP